MNIFWGLIGVTVGVLVIKYSIWITENFGTIEWAEQHLRGGMAGTISFYRIVGIVIIILSLMYMFGSFGIIAAPLGSVFGPPK